VALAAGVVAGSGDEGPEPERRADAPPPTAAVDRLTLRRQVGQLLVSSFDGTSVPDYLRRRLRAGETAGVIAFAGNGGGVAAWRALTGQVQRAARGSALVAVDQEGGAIRSLPFAGPAAAAPLQGGPGAVRSASRGAARDLRDAGVNVDLAPVADVATPGSVMAGRAFPGRPAEVAERVAAAVAGFRDAGVAGTAKHFPGLGPATVNTDDGGVTIDPGPGHLRPFAAAVRAGVPLVMLSHALYPALDRRRIASQSPAIVRGLLRDRLGFRGAVVTDSLEAAAVLERSGIAAAAERSVRAGADLVLMTGSASWNGVFPRLLARARREPGFRRIVRAAAARVLALKRSLGLPPPA
jgi:beta-N-acetylhexosaminidase